MNALRQAREARGWSRVEVAYKAGISFGTVSNLENGGVPNLKNAKTLAALFGTTIEELFPSPETSEASA